MDEGLIKEEEEEAWKMCEQFLFSCVTENVSSCGYITTKTEAKQNRKLVTNFLKTKLTNCN